MKKFLAIMLAVVLMCGCLVACSGKKNEAAGGDSIVGTWELDLDKMLEGQEQAIIDMMKGMGYSMTFTFNADGTGSTTMSMSDESETTDFKYEIKDNQIVIGDEGADYKLEGNTLTLIYDGEELPLTRK